MRLKYLVIALLLIVPLGYLFHDIVITNLLSMYYCAQDPNPKTQIIKKVEYPESIYWEDNVYPGFSKEDRALMILNYLDGKHLKTMALNGADGKIYLYHLDAPLWKRFEASHASLKRAELYKAYAEEIMKDEKVYTKESMPTLNYTVTFNEVKLNDFARKFLYADETKITDNKSKEVIAYNRRIMRLYYILQPDFAGGRYYWKEPMCGGDYNLDYSVFYTNKYFGNHNRNIHKILSKRYLKNKG